METILTDVDSSQVFGKAYDKFIELKNKITSEYNPFKILENEGYIPSNYPLETSFNKLFEELQGNTCNPDEDNEIRKQYCTSSKNILEAFYNSLKINPSK
jgi:hypothetical protein